LLNFLFKSLDFLVLIDKLLKLYAFANFLIFSTLKFLAKLIFRYFEVDACIAVFLSLFVERSRSHFVTSIYLFYTNRECINNLNPERKKSILIWNQIYKSFIMKTNFNILSISKSIEYFQTSFNNKT
jgi:hypothetical protein